jgi:hypothetical protein
MPDYAKIWEIQQLLHPRPVSLGARRTYRQDLIMGHRFYIREGEVLWWNPEKRCASREALTTMKEKVKAILVLVQRYFAHNEEAKQQAVFTHTSSESQVVWNQDIGRGYHYRLL